MPAIHVCPECNAELPGDAPEGLCPKCLLQSGFNSNGHEPFADGNGTSVYQSLFVPPSPAELAHRFPQLEILELLGQGGMGAVYKARQKKLDRLVALKILPPTSGREPSFADRFAREAKALARLSHPNIVAIHDFGEADGLFYFIMEFVDGPNLRQVLQVGPIEPGQALNIVPQVCDALQYAHEEGIVHRDIKPENILLDKRGRVKIADFGLAKLLGHVATFLSLTGSQQVMGTPYYMAPEQMHRTHNVDHRADIYSLGVVLYEMLTGDLPMGRFALPSEKAAVDTRLDDVIMKALEKEPEQRYQRISEVKGDLQAISGEVQTGPLLANTQRLELETIRQCLEVPSTLMIVVSALLLFASVCFIVLMVLWPNLCSPSDRQRYLELHPALYHVLGFGIGILGILASGLFFSAAYSMRHFSNYGLAMTGCVFLLPTGYFSWLGAWGMWRLTRKEVKAAFRAKRAGLSHVTLSPPKPKLVKKLGSFARNMGEFVFHTMPKKETATPLPARGWNLPALKLPQVKLPASPLPAAYSPPPVIKPAEAELPKAQEVGLAGAAHPANPDPTAESNSYGVELSLAGSLVGSMIVVGIISAGSGLQIYLYVAVFVAYLITHYNWKFPNVKLATGILVMLLAVIFYATMHKMTDPLGLGFLAQIALLYFGYEFLTSFRKEEEAKAAENNWGLAKEDADLLRTLRKFNVTPLAEIEANTMTAVRKSCAVPPDDRILGLYWLEEENEKGENCLLFGTQGIYYHQGREHPGCYKIPYADFAKRSFVNHGKAIYLGNDQYMHVDPDSVECEELTSLLNAVQQTLRAR